MKRLILQDLSQILSSELFPNDSAYSWDNVGLIVGDPAAPLTGVLVAVDLTEAALTRAKSLGFNAIIVHHPPIFPKDRGLSRVVKDGTEDSLSSLIFKCVRDGVAVLAMHTNFDLCSTEAMENLAKALGIHPKGRLFAAKPGVDRDLLKLTTFVPAEYLDAVCEAVFEAGAGNTGHYDECGFHGEGEGTFKPKSDAKPFVGKSGELEKTSEIRFETLLPIGLKSRVVKALKKVHPYEEVAFDLYPVIQDPVGKGLCAGHGIGFYGEFLGGPVSGRALAERLKFVFETSCIRVSAPGDLVDFHKREFKNLAFSPGSGSSFVGGAFQSGVEIYVTGEVGYHEALSARRKGKVVVEVGHPVSEKYFLETMVDVVNRFLAYRGFSTPAEKMALAIQFMA